MSKERGGRVKNAPEAHGYSFRTPPWVAGSARALGQTYRTLERALRAKAEKSLGESTGGRVDCRKRVIFSLRRTFSEGS